MHKIKHFLKKYKTPLLIAIILFLAHLALSSFYLSRYTGFLRDGYFYSKQWLMFIPAIITLLLGQTLLFNNPILYAGSTISPLANIIFGLIYFLWIFTLTIIFYVLYKKNKVAGIISLVLFLVILYFLFRYPAPPFSWGGTNRQNMPLFLRLFK